MFLVLEVQSGSYKGKTYIVPPGHQLQVGRSHRADISFPKDVFISSTHFLLENNNGQFWIADLNSRNGTFLNSKQVQRAELHDGDVVMAGRTLFTLHLLARETDPITRSGSTPSSSGDNLDLPVTADAFLYDSVAQARRSRLLDLLNSEKYQPLYAVLNTAADKRLLARIYNEPQTQALVRSEDVTEVIQSSLHLVGLPTGSKLLASLVSEGWGRHWGIYMTYRGPLQALPLHLHNLRSLPQRSGNQEFRYYDPRELNQLLETCSPDEAARLLGPIEHLLLEGKNPDVMVRFSRSQQGVTRTDIPLTN